MTEAKYKDWILETIDSLRKRKARPDLERICHMVERRYGLTFAETEADLERLVDSETVIKVYYKGSTSYRNAAKWRRSHLGGHVLNSNDASRNLRDAIRALTIQQANSHSSIADAQGASLREIEKYLLSLNSQTNLAKAHLLVAVTREVDGGRLIRLSNGNFTLTESKYGFKSKATAAANANTTSVHSQGNKSITPSKKGRPATKRKRFKKSHGPDFVENYDVPQSLVDDKCDYCLLTAQCNRNGDPEELLVCKDCNAKAHPSCMEYSKELAMRSRMSPWQCIDCKTCYVCDDSGDADSMLFCDACDKGYHMGCHSPKIIEKPTGKWVCSRCGHEMDIERNRQTENEQDSETQNTGVDGLPTPCDSPVQELEMNKRFLNCNKKREAGPQIFFGNNVIRHKKEIFPDASDWSIQDVVNFFKKAGFPDQAYVFQEQEIDGKSLLLMKRSDVLTGLSLKLGPALKIYSRVRQLQSCCADLSSLF